MVISSPHRDHVHAIDLYDCAVLQSRRQLDRVRRNFLSLLLVNATDAYLSWNFHINRRSRFHALLMEREAPWKAQ
jgi:hypothetical protein